MLRYIMKRTFYSLLIIGGVMILTFILFHLSSGDPASTVLGKNPSPEELENMRTALGSVPVFIPERILHLPVSREILCVSRENILLRGKVFSWKKGHFFL